MGRFGRTRRHLEPTWVALAALVLLVLVVLGGCTDAERAKLHSFGDAHRIRCFSGGRLILEDTSSGRVHNEEQSDGFYYMSAKDGKLIRVSGECIIEVAG
jgi:hypothetical protein